jgi:uncharacterized protein with HEPN domain
MSKRDDHATLNDMLSHAREALELLGASSRQELERDRLKQLALTRLVEIVGEAANRLSAATQEAHPEIPWPQIVGMRNRLIHGYDVIDWDLLWDTVRSDLPPLIAALETIIDEA